MNLGIMKRRFSVGEKQPDIYEGCVTLEFTETTDNHERPITENNNNVITYLDKLIIDGVEINIAKNYKHTFALGKHKVGWKFKTSIIYASVIATTSSISSPVADQAHITIPSHITEIKAMAMRSQPAYAPRGGVICYAIQPPVAVSTSMGLWYINATNNTYIRVPAESVATYKVAEGWKQFASRIIAI